jgi:hypothetical protein
MWGGSVVYNFDPRGIHDHALLSQIPDYPNLEGQVPVFLSPPQNKVGPVISVLTRFPLSSRTTQGFMVDVFESTSTRAADVMALLSPTP